MIDRWRMALPLLRYRAQIMLVAYVRLVGICLVGAGAIVGSLWTWAHLFALIAPWPL